MVKLFEEVADEQKLKILAIFERTSDTVKTDINAIKEWLEKQPHLPEVPNKSNLCDVVIENFLKISKFSIEIAKRKIDAFYTIFSSLPKMLHMTTINPNSPIMTNYANLYYNVPLPKLTDDFCRITIFKFILRNPDPFDLTLTGIRDFHGSTIRMLEDCTVDNTEIYDLENLTLRVLTKFDVATVKTLLGVHKKVFKRSIKSMHLINCPGMLNSALKVAKAVLSPKMMDRIVVHDSLETLYDYVPKHLLPNDYGGGLESLKTLNEKLLGKFAEYKNYFDHLDILKVNDNLRPVPLVDDELFGSYGNFRKLNVD